MMPNYFLAGDVGSNLASALSSNSLWTNIAKTIIFILLGFFFTKKKLLPENTGKVLTRFVMAVCLPCLAFCSFMSDYTVQGGIDAIFNFIFGFILYILFIFIGKGLFIFIKDKKKRTVLAVLFAFGSTTFFGYPIVSAVYGTTAGNNFNIMNVAYRVFLYSYAYVSIANIEDEKEVEQTVELDANGQPVLKVQEKKKFDKNEILPLLKKVFVNPIVLATLIGLFLWFLQAIPGSDLVPNTIYGQKPSTVKNVAFWRLDVTLPWIFQAANTLGGLSSTIILFAIGCTLGGTDIKEAAKDKYAWIWTGLKVFVAPTIVLCLLLAIQAIANGAGWLPVTKEIINEVTGETETIKTGISQLISVNTVSSSIITWMVPPATVAVGYCISFDKEKEMASHISLISTFGSVVGIVIWVILITVINSTGFFAGA